MRHKYENKKYDEKYENNKNHKLQICRKNELRQKMRMKLNNGRFKYNKLPEDAQIEILSYLQYSNSYFQLFQ